MAFNFPNSPALNDLYTPAGGPVYRWNGTVWVINGASTFTSDDAGLIGMFPTTAAPAGWLKANGAAVSLLAYPRLLAIYCGNTDNATALHGYRCTNPANPTGTRSTTGDYIVLPDGRGEFFRGLDDGRGVDTSRSLWAAQAHAFAQHNHAITDPGHTHPTSPSGTLLGNNGSGIGLNSSGGTVVNYGTTIASATTGISIQNAGSGAETRPRNLAALVCIKY